jgi:5-methyltetrahydrofolate--homocysteine methyltransferase
VGEAASKVFEEGQAMLKKIVDGRWLTANGAVALLPANTVNDDDIEVYTDDTRSEVAFTWYGLRQQGVKPVVDGVQRPNQCLSDFIAPKDRPACRLHRHVRGDGRPGRREDREALRGRGRRLLVDHGEGPGRPPGRSLCRVHARARAHRPVGLRTLRGLSNEQLIKEAYVGIRPAPGYPACPEHTVKAELFKTLQAEEIGMELTESFAMYPGAAVSGFYFSHPESKYFVVGKIGQDQLDDMARGVGWRRRDGALSGAESLSVIVIPAKAGIHAAELRNQRSGHPACAGTT